MNASAVFTGCAFLFLLATKSPATGGMEKPMAVLPIVAPESKLALVMSVRMS